MLSLRIRDASIVAVLMIGCGAATPPAKAPGDPEPASSEAGRELAGASQRRDAGLTGERDREEDGRAAAAPQSDGRPPSSMEPEQPGAPEPPPPLPEGTTILHIGDSFAGALGIDLNRELKKAGVKGVLKYETSSYIPTWAWSKQLDQYLWRWRPDLVLITLGANELQIPEPRDRIRTIRRLVERLDGRPCVWIGPPLWEGARGALLDVIRENVEPCIYMDSTALLPELARARDKIHPSAEARKTWARFVVDWLARQRRPDGERPWDLRPVEPPD